MEIHMGQDWESEWHFTFIETPAYFKLRFMIESPVRAIIDYLLSSTPAFNRDKLCGFEWVYVFLLEKFTYAKSFWAKV